MIKDNLLLIIDEKGRFLQTPLGILKANAQYTANITVLAPFDLDTTVSIVFERRDRIDERASLYLMPNGKLKGKDFLDQSYDLYQKVENYNVFENVISGKALQYIATYRAGSLFISVNFGLRQTPALATNYKGVFGKDNPLPDTANNGDYYECNTYNYLVNDTLFTLGDIAYFNNGKWYRSNYRGIAGTEPIPIPIKANIQAGIEVESDLDLAVLLAERVAQNEADIIALDKRFNNYYQKSETYERVEIDDKDAAVLQEAKDYTYSKVEIVMNKAENLEDANMLKDVVYNNVNGVLTFTRYDDTTKEIDLPLELIVTSGYYDEVANELVLVLANSSEIRIPVDNLLTDLDAHNIRFNGSGTNYLVNKNDVESAVKELDTRVKTNADNVALKVNTSDIVDNLNSTDTDKPLSANQGKVLNDTTAKLAVSNVFTQPQQVPNATLPQHTTNLNQVETMFEMFKQQLRGYNLASPDLTGKEYLGNGEYHLGYFKGVRIQYNVYNGIFTFNGEVISSGTFNIFNLNLLPNSVYTIKHIYVSGDDSGLSSNAYPAYPYNVSGNRNWPYYKDKGVTFDNYSRNSYGWYVTTTAEFIDFKFKLQLEKGDTATPYTVPGQIPQYKIVGEE